MQVVFMRQSELWLNATHPDTHVTRPQVQFQPIGSREKALDFLRGNIDPGPVLVGTVDVDVPYDVWIDRDQAAPFTSFFACVDNGVKAWHQARAFKKSFEEARDLRKNLSPRCGPRRGPISI